jgi:protoporphyrinogen oxidase
MKKKTIIIGAGISGLSIGQMLKDKNEVIVFESADRPGGLIKCYRVEDCLFHRTGGHVFNTKFKEVSDWFWHFFNKDIEFIRATRNAVVSLTNSQFIPYPIENNFFLLDNEIVNKIIDDLLKIKLTDSVDAKNFEEFLRNRFGKTLYDLYFKPYNEKVWRKDLSKIPLSWLEGKLPMPTVKEILFYNIKQIEEQTFVHSSFYYPKNDGSQFIANRLSQGLNIHYNTFIESVLKTDKGWKVNDIEADYVIFCGNVKQLPSLVSNQIDLNDYLSGINDLESHGTTTVFCEVQVNPYSWIYMPSNAHESHRMICTGNFASSNNAHDRMTATVEFTDQIDIMGIKSNLAKMPFSPKYLTHHYEKFTYPIQNISTRAFISELKKRLAFDNFYMTGRFADWEYYNMDTAIAAAMRLSDKFNSSKP